MITTTGVMMGKGAPNRQKTGNVVQCAIVLSPDLGLIRIWPLHPSEHKDITIWSVVSLKIEKTGNDNRYESYSLISIVKTGKIQDHLEKQNTLNRCCLKSQTSDPQKFQNDNKKSIYLVRPEQIIEHTISRNEIDPLRSQEELQEDGWVQDQKNRQFRAVVKWKSTQGVEHTMGVVAQEVSEWIRKQEPYANRIFENLRVMDLNWDKWFLCGNLKDHRNAWVIVNVFRLKKTERAITPLFWPMFDGVSADWPYSKQEAMNVKIADSGQTQFPFMSITTSTTLTDYRGNMATTSCQSYANTAIGESITNE